VFCGEFLKSDTLRDLDFSSETSKSFRLGHVTRLPFLNVSAFELLFECLPEAIVSPFHDSKPADQDISSGLVMAVWNGSGVIRHLTGWELGNTMYVESRYFTAAESDTSYTICVRVRISGPQHHPTAPCRR